MQTFLPYADFEQSAKCLDNKRLGKQRSECIQLLQAITDPAYPYWKKHPCTLMWKDYVDALTNYGAFICIEWKRRGFKDTCEAKIMAYAKNFVIAFPPWYGNEQFHASHRSNLLRKDPVWYGKFGWTEPNNVPYFWPTKE